MVNVPSDVIAGLLAHGWQFIIANEQYAFFERPGYWLRLSKPFEKHAWQASIMPELYRVPSPDVGCFVAFPVEQQAPEYRGRGARAKALAAAAQLWDDNAAYLTPLGIDLVGVGVRLFKGTGTGGFVTTRTYYGCDSLR